MASRRIPLANNPNAANSPYRGTTASKRARNQSEDHENDPSPPVKKQLVDFGQNAYRRPQQQSLEDPDGRVFTDKNQSTSSQLLLKRLAAARDTKQTNQRVLDKQTEKQADKQTGLDREAVRRWRRHYRKEFPKFVFYFENLPLDVASRAAKQIAGLGAREEKFFSKEVTHVLTTRPIPTSPVDTAPSDGKISILGKMLQPKNATINPSLLEKSHDTQSNTASQAGRNALDFVSSRRPQATSQGIRPQANVNDILYKAREMGKKLWALEKFERMIQHLYEPDSEDDDDRSHRRVATSKLVPLKRERDWDLSQLLKNERNNAPVDRKPWQDIIPFRGYHMYVHDMDERVRPVMVREYAIPPTKEEGEWPMLHSVSSGRCPFIEEPQRDERELKLRAKEKAAKAKAAEAASQAPRTRSAVAAGETGRTVPRTRSVTRSPHKQALGDAGSAAVNSMPRPAMPASRTSTADAPKLQRHTSGSFVDMPPLLGSAQANFRGIPRNPGGEPMASGLQQNVTSAIRSQMYSSTAPSAPGTRVGMSKQQHQMSRRVLERQSGLSANSMPSSLNVNDVRAAINQEPSAVPRRTTRQRAAETMTKIYEDETLSEDEQSQQDSKAQKSAARKKKAAKREPKPGYCENCRDKYDDFQEHIISKKHRKFAFADENWTELDDLLTKLKRH